MSEQSTTATTTTLRITFAGLCMCVQDGERGDEQTLLHVLLPGGSQHADHHEARLYFNLRHLLGESARNGLCVVDLSDSQIDLAQMFATPGANLQSLSPLTPMSCVTGSRVPRAHLDNDTPGQYVKTRITIDAGRRGHVGSGVRWNLKDCTRRWMPTWMEWVIDGVPNTGIPLRIRGLNGSQTDDTLNLHPFDRTIIGTDGGNHRERGIDLFLFHSPVDELPVSLPALPFPRPANKPQAGSPAPHFKAFYPLVNESEDNPIPTYQGDDSTAENGESSSESREEGNNVHDGMHPARTRGTLGLDYTCIMTTAPSEPKP